MSIVPSPKSMVSESRAPFVYFEHVPAMSAFNGVFCLQLASGRPLAVSDGSLLNEMVSVGQLQGTRQALNALRTAIDRILAVPADARAPGLASDELWRH